MTAIPDPNTHAVPADASLRSHEGLYLTISNWERLSAQLSALLGERGSFLLYARCVHQTRSSFPWLNEASSHSFKASLQQLSADLAARESAEADAASAALLAIFTDTLIVLIGELMTSSILQRAWIPAVVDNVAPEPQE